jgi:hypothetical protein
MTMPTLLFLLAILSLVARVFGFRSMALALANSFEDFDAAVAKLL